MRVCTLRRLRGILAAMRSRFILGVLAGLAGACDENRIRSDDERFAVYFDPLRTEDLVAWEPPYRALSGTRLCPRARCSACDADDRCEAVAVSASGSVHPVGECLVADEPGAVEWRVGAPCDDLDAPTDRAHLEVVAADQVGAELLLWPDRLVARGMAETQGAGFSAALGDPVRVVAGGQVRLPVRLFTRADDHVVAWADGRVDVTATGGRAPVVYPGDALELVAFPGSEAAATFTAGGVTWPIGQVVGVPASDARALELAVAFAPVEGGVSPSVARARVTDAAGATLLGLPVTWSVTGKELALVVDTNLPGPDYINISDVCTPPEQRGGPRHAELSATHGELSASVVLHWTGVAGPPDPKWAPPDSCPDAGGCGCRTQRGGPWALALLGLLALRRRGRPR